MNLGELSFVRSYRCGGEIAKPAPHIEIWRWPPGSPRDDGTYDILASRRGEEIRRSDDNVESNIVKQYLDVEPLEAQCLLYELLGSPTE